MKLRTYTGDALEILGQARVEVTYQDQTADVYKKNLQSLKFLCKDLVTLHPFPEHEET